MANVKLFWRDSAVAGTVTASTTATNYPVNRVQTDVLADQWKTTGVGTDEWLKVDLGSAIDVTAFALLGHDLTSGDSLLKIQASATDSWGSPAIDTTITYNATNLKYFWDSAQSYRWWRFIFTKSGASEVRSVGRFMIGQQFACTENASVSGVEWGWDDLSDVQVTKSGQSYAELNTILKTLSVEFPFSSLTQMEEFQALAQTFGKTRSFLISLDDDTKPYDWLFYGRVEDVGSEKLESWHATAALTRWNLALEMVQTT